MPAVAETRTPSAVTPSHVVAVLGAGLVLGVAGDLLFKDARAGLNVFAWVAGCCAWATFLSSHGYAEARPAPDWWQLPAVLFAGFFAVREAPDLLALDFLALCLALTLPILRGRGLSPWSAGIEAVARAAARLAGQVAAGAVLLVGRDLEWDGVSGAPAVRRATRIVTALAAAAPVVLVFALLFASADPVFGAALRTLGSLDLGEVPVHGFLVLFFGAVAAGFLRARLWGAGAAAPAPPRALQLDSLAVLTAVGGMAGVFLLFTALQARALTGGASFVQATTGLTLAEYARSGFFQCLLAAGLALPLLYAADAALEAADAGARRSFRALAALQLLLIGAVLASAAVRLSLYIDGFGLTTSRVFGVAGLGWIGMVAAWFAFTVLRGRRAGFVFGSIMAGFAALAALNLANPAGLVARVDLARALAGRARLDTAYVGALGRDAAPVIADALPRLDAADRCSLAQALAAQAAPPDGPALREWNLARWRANAAAQTAAAWRRSCPLPGPAGE